MKLDPEERIFDIANRILLGKEVTEEEKKLLRARNAKYELVRYVYMEKMRADGHDLLNFQFTPGSDWMEVPVFDMVANLLELNRKIESREVKPIKPSF